MPDFLVFCAFVPRLLGARVALFMKEPTPELAATLGQPRPVLTILEGIERRALDYADVAFTVTDDLKERYIRRGADGRKIHVILNGPDVRHLTCKSGPYIHDENRFIFFCHGSIERRYGHEVLIEAIDLVRKRIPHIQLRIAGYGSHVPVILEHIEKLRLQKHVKFLGWLSESALASELARADVGVVPLQASPYSHLIHTNKMYEYILFDTPVLASRLDSVARYFGEDSLRFFDAGDASSLAAAIIDLQDHPLKRQRMARSARNLYDTSYSWTLQREKLLSVYESLFAVSDSGASRGAATWQGP